MDGVMRLPRDLEIRYHNDVYAFEKVNNVDYVTSAEQFGIEKGMQASHQEVWETAERKTKLESAREMLAAKLDIELVKRITKLTEDDLVELE
jgi:predicted transposase/invertase (TIGR01784 family)